MDQYYILLDFQGVTWDNFSLQKMMMLIPAMTSVHVGRLYKILIVNATWFASGIISVAKKLVT